MTSRRVPIPFIFFLVVAATIFMIIFFGAWAVSADSREGGRALTFGFASGGGSSNVTALSSSQAGDPGTPGLNQITGEAAEDSWWGSAFLRACPFH